MVKGVTGNGIDWKRGGVLGIGIGKEFTTALTAV
jgi:hypothetical protein